MLETPGDRPPTPPRADPPNDEPPCGCERTAEARKDRRPSDTGSSGAASLEGSGGGSSSDDQALKDAYKKRKEDRKAKRQGHRLDKKAFLSDLPEDVDIRYRTSFIVVGAQAKALVVNTCNSREARSLASAAKAPTEGVNLDQKMLAQAVEKFLSAPGMSDMRVLEALAVGKTEVAPAMLADAPPIQDLLSSALEPSPPDGEDYCFCRARVDESMVPSSSGVVQHRSSNGSRGSRGSRNAAEGNSESGANGSSPDSRGRPRLSQRGPELVKMQFQTVTSFVQELPLCHGRKEALCTCIVFPLLVDGDPARGEDNFSEQLRDLARWSQEVTIRTRETPDKRPWRAVLLVRAMKDSPYSPTGSASCVTASCTTSSWSGHPGKAGASSGQSWGSEDGDSARDSWRERLQEFESENGALWKLGPIWIEDGNGIHAALAEISGNMLSRSLAGRRESQNVLMESWGGCADGHPPVFFSVWSDEMNHDLEERSPSPAPGLASKRSAGVFTWTKKAFGLSSGDS